MDGFKIRVGMQTRKSSSEAKKVSAKLSESEAKRQLDSFLAKYDPEVEAFARRALAKMRKLVKGAIEMVYDNYNWLVIGFGPTDRPSEAIFSIVMPPGRCDLVLFAGSGLTRSGEAPAGNRPRGAEHSALRRRPAGCQSVG